MSKIKNNLGYILAVFFSLLPVLFWMMTETFPYKFSDPSSVWQSLGQVTGLAGTAMFSISLILGSRLKILEKLFNGMNRVYIAHHLFGGLAFLLLLIHPLLLAVSYVLVSFHNAAVFLLPNSDWAINLGKISLLFLMSLLIVTYYVDLPYQIWRFTHKFLGFVFFLGGIHMYFVPSDVARDHRLQIYMISISVIGLTLYLYRTVFGRFFIKKVTYMVTGVRKINDTIVELDMLPEAEPLKFEPGQFIFISFKDRPDLNETHPFSISSANTANDLKLTIKSLGDYTKTILELTPGAEVSIEGPYGKFSYRNFANKSQVWIAGGIGITPFLSMAGTLSESDVSADLYYVVRSPEEAVYLDELTAMAAGNSKFRVFPVFTKVQGRITADNIEKVSGNLKTKDFFLCGPPPMMGSFKRQLRHLGVAAEKIHSEEFQFL